MNRRINKRNMSVTNPQDNANPSAETGTDTNVFFYDYCEGLASHEGKTVRMFVADMQTGEEGTELE